MCKAIIDGGQRCAGHTRGPAREAVTTLLRQGPAELGKKGAEDIINYASTPTGAKELAELSEALDKEALATGQPSSMEKAAFIEDAVKRGATRREANVEFARTLREMQGMWVSPYDLEKPAIELGSGEAVGHALEEIGRTERQRDQSMMGLTDGELRLRNSVNMLNHQRHQAGSPIQLDENAVAGEGMQQIRQIAKDAFNKIDESPETAKATYAAAEAQAAKALESLGLDPARASEMGTLVLDRHLNAEHAKKALNDALNLHSSAVKAAEQTREAIGKAEEMRIAATVNLTTQEMKLRSAIQDSKLTTKKQSSGETLDESALSGKILMRTRDLAQSAASSVPVTQSISLDSRAAGKAREQATAFLQEMGFNAERASELGPDLVDAHLRSIQAKTRLESLKKIFAPNAV